MTAVRVVLPIIVVPLALWAMDQWLNNGDIWRAITGSLRRMGYI